MLLGRITGTVWGAKESENLRGAKIVKVQPLAMTAGRGTLALSADGPAPVLGGAVRLAVDQLGAGVGEYVLVAHGSRVRDLTVGQSMPVKDVVVAIVDSCEVDRALLGGDRR